MGDDPYGQRAHGERGQHPFELGFAFGQPDMYRADAEPRADGGHAHQKAV